MIIFLIHLHLVEAIGHVNVRRVLVIHNIVTLVTITIMDVMRWGTSAINPPSYEVVILIAVAIFINGTASVHKCRAIVWKTIVSGEMAMVRKVLGVGMQSHRTISDMRVEISISSEVVETILEVRD